MTTDEKQQLTDSVLNLHSQVKELGRKSVPLVIECGKTLTQIQDSLPRGRWMDWQMEHRHELSIKTVARYRKVYNLSLVTNLDGLTLMEVYEKVGEKKQPKTETPTENGENGEQQPTPETNLHKVNCLVKELLDILTTSEKEELLEMMVSLESIVHFYEEKVGPSELKEAA